MIYLSGTFLGIKTSKSLIEDKIKKVKYQKDLSQPSRIKTCGSTFKNPIDQSTKKVWQLIKDSVSLNIKFGDAEISKKHCNFLINRKSATSLELEKLINAIKKKVFNNTGIDLELELKIIGEKK